MVKRREDQIGILGLKGEITSREVVDNLMKKVTTKLYEKKVAEKTSYDFVNKTFAVHRY